MLRKIRIILAAVFLTGITLLFLGIGQQWWGWMAKLQFLPACLALNWGIIAAVLLLTFVFGRIYCSFICPLGVFQDAIIRLRRVLGKRSRAKSGTKKPLISTKRFEYNRNRRWLRAGVGVFCLVCIIAGWQLLIIPIAPYSAYGRMVSSIVAPHWGAVTILAVITFAGLFWLSWSHGRAWCNNICPVGWVLGEVSRISLFRPVIDKSKCTACARCHRGCKCSCIDGEERKIDYSRCVVCFDCIDNCREGAISYRFAYGRNDQGTKEKSRTADEAGNGTDAGRRAFISGILIAGASATVKAQEKKVDGGLAAIEAKKEPERKERLVPFGAGSAKHFYSRCTACQLCVSSCPNDVLRPSTDLEHLMQPVMGYENGWCRPECTTCSQVCPAGAILPLTPEEKSSIHIGRAVVDRDLCVVLRDGVQCGNCARHCPSGAILMIPSDPQDPNSLKIPTVTEEKCIGCGACEFLCPSRPFSAIHVDGLRTHITE